MSFTKLHELNQSLSQYLLDTFSVVIPDPGNNDDFFHPVLTRNFSALAAINASLKDSYSDDLGK